MPPIITPLFTRGISLQAMQGVSISISKESPIFGPPLRRGLCSRRLSESIDKLLEIDIRDICYAHFGIHPDAKGMLERYKSQLVLWRDVIAEQMKESGAKGLVERCIPVLLERDEMFRGFKDLTEEEKGRERHFIKTCIRGISEQATSRS